MPPLPPNPALPPPPPNPPLPPFPPSPPSPQKIGAISGRGTFSGFFAKFLEGLLDLLTTFFGATTLGETLG